MKQPMITDRKWLVARLREIAEDKQRQTSYHLLMKMEEGGYLDPVERKVTPGRGKPRKFYVLSKKGRNLVNLAKAWDKKAEQKAASNG